jgi:hypothetical protein
MRRTMRSALAASLLLLSACAHPGSGTAARGLAPADYFPLAVGNQWVWEDQSPQLPEAQRGAARTVRILERTADGFYRDSERGELRAGPDCVRDRVRQLLCQPLTAGATWKSVVSASSTEKYQIAGVDETVTTPAGTFRGCVRVRAVNAAGPGTELVAEISYAPRVGPVKLETFAVARGEATPQLRAVLRSYHLEGK